jgi:peptidoglycan/xylan/chitin deacetylase (PgdA/CDA1 family)
MGTPLSVKLTSHDTLTATGWRSALRALQERRSLILCYHGVAPSRAAEDPEFLRVDPDRFRQQVELLLESGFDFVTVADLAARVGPGGPPPGLVAMSFDDGMDDNHSFVMPILRSYGLTGTIYVTTGMIGRPNPWISHSARMMSADEIRDLCAAGFEIGAHTVNHPDMSKLDLDACRREVGDSRRELEDLLGQRVRTFAYPFCTYSEHAIQAVREAGFEAAVTCHGRGRWSQFEMKRSMITGKDGLASFVLKSWDAYKPLFDSPPGRAFRSATRGARKQLRAVRERS